jgi:uncharacterized Zn finger protein
MRSEKDYCKCCKSENLFDNHIGKDGFYDENGRYVTMCQDCGTIQQDYLKKLRKLKIKKGAV